MSAGKVHDAFAKAKAAGLSWADMEAPDDDALETRLYGARRRAAARTGRRPTSVTSWPTWAARSRVAPFVRLAHMVKNTSTASTPPRSDWITRIVSRSAFSSSVDNRTSLRPRY